MSVPYPENRPRSVCSSSIRPYTREPDQPPRGGKASRGPRTASAWSPPRAYAPTAIPRRGAGGRADCRGYPRAENRQRPSAHERQSPADSARRPGQQAAATRCPCRRESRQNTLVRFSQHGFPTFAVRRQIPGGHGHPRAARRSLKACRWRAGRETSHRVRFPAKEVETCPEPGSPILDPVRGQTPGQWLIWTRGDQALRPAKIRPPSVKPSPKVPSEKAPIATALQRGQPLPAAERLLLLGRQRLAAALLAQRPAGPHAEVQIVRKSSVDSSSIQTYL